MSEIAEERREVREREAALAVGEGGVDHGRDGDDEEGDEERGDRERDRQAMPAGDACDRSARHRRDRGRHRVTSRALASSTAFA